MARMTRLTRPRGRLIQKAQRQPGPSVSQPPMSGPATEARPNTAPIGAMYLARSRTGTTSAMIVCDMIMRPPPPRPWTNRNADSSTMPWANPHRADPVRNSTMPVMNRALRPNRSPILP